MMQRLASLIWAAGPLAALIAQVSLFTSCMSLRHKVDPVSITLNVKLENANEDASPLLDAEPTGALSNHPKYELTAE